MAERIVLFGGTFNPIHHGHLIVARAVAEHFGFEKVTLVPACLPPHKREHGRLTFSFVDATPEDRLAMTRLAAEGDELFEVSDVEIRRGGASFTYDTLMHFRSLHGADAQLYWIIGADMLIELPNWHRAREVAELATLVTAGRAPFSQETAVIEQNLENAFGPEMAKKLLAYLAPTPLIDISSTDIRRRRKEGRSVKYLTPCAVQDYMNSRHLYVAKSD